MRRFILHIVSFLILLASTGLKLQAHYCHGHFAGIKFVYNSCCCDEKKADCCEDKVIQVEKADFDYAPQPINELSSNSQQQFCGFFDWSWATPAFDQNSNNRTNPRGSPLGFSRSIYIIYQRLLFYG